MDARDLQPEADVSEQQRPAVPSRPEPDPAEIEVPLEAEPADVAEQAGEVGYDEDDDLREGAQP